MGRGTAAIGLLDQVQLKGQRKIEALAGPDQIDAWPYPSGGVSAPLANDRGRFFKADAVSVRGSYFSTYYQPLRRSVRAR